MNTIAAISTPYGTGGVALIRMSGFDAVKIAERVFLPHSGLLLQDTENRKAIYGRIYDGDEMVDDGILTIFNSPNSYTGENVVEISCHGGILVTKRVLEACVNAGARPAKAGEFTKRALLNGKMSLTQAESVIDIINAENRQFLKYSLSQRSNALDKRVTAVYNTLLGIATQIAAWIDYPDELDSFEVALQLGQLTECELQMRLLLESYNVGKMLRDGVLTAIVGKPNVGKSTLMNLLTGTNRSIVTDIPGTTRDIIEEYINLGEITLRLSDCAGLRETEDEVENIGVARMYERIDEAELILAVFDNSRKLDKDDYALLEKIKNKTRICLINKSDLESNLDMTFLATQFSYVIEICAKDMEDIEPITSVITKALQLSRIDMNSGFIANERQRGCLISAHEYLKDAIKDTDNGAMLDTTGYLLEKCLDSLLELKGEKASEHIIDEIFKRFCVGK